MNRSFLCRSPVLLVVVVVLFLTCSTAEAANQTKTTTITTTTTTTKKKKSSLDHGILDWVRHTRNGYYHPNQEFRVDPETGITGVFATKDIRKGATLVSVPWSHVMPSDDPEEYGQLCCGLVDRLKREWKLGKESHFAPYINYLKKNYNKTTLPTMWSPKGQTLLGKIVGTKHGTTKTILPPRGPFKWLEKEWFPKCDGNSNDKLGIKAAMVVIQRSDDHILIPGRLLSLLMNVGCN